VRAASECGIGVKMALKQMNGMLDKFEMALETAANELKNAGFTGAYDMKERILKSGGYRYIS
jgi:mRNA-degrading endonuclease HigB of HigAB toxin-antitoxin module